MAKIKYQMYEVINADGETSQVLPETSADIVTIEDTAQKYTATNVEGALAEIATKIDELDADIAQAGKVDDVQDVNGQTIVVNKIAKLSKKAVGLDKVDNTADADKVVKEAGKVGNKLILKNATKSFAEYDGSMPIGVTFKDADFDLAQVVGDGISIGVKDKGYSTKSYVDTELAKKYDKTGGTISGDVTITGKANIGGDVVVSGNFTVGGKTTTVESENLQVKDKLITVAKDNTVALTSPAGMVVPKADGTNDVALVVDNTKMAKVGKVVLDASGNIDTTQSDLQTLATRRDDLTNDKPVKWNATDKTLESDTRKYTQSDVAETITKEWNFDGGIKTTTIKNKQNELAISIGYGAIGKGASVSLGDSQQPLTNLYIGTAAERPRVFVYDVTTGAQIESGQIALKNDITGSDVTVANAKNVTETIAGKKITDIFENNSTIVKKSTLAETANVANKVANALTVSGQNGNGTEQAVTYNGSAPITVDYDGSDFTTTVEDGTLAVELVDTGVVPSGQDTAVFSAVAVNSKGIVQNGGLSMEFGKAGQTTPSTSLMVGGLFFKRI